MGRPIAGLLGLVAKVVHTGQVSSAQVTGDIRRRATRAGKGDSRLVVARVDSTEEHLFSPSPHVDQWRIPQDKARVRSAYLDEPQLAVQHGGKEVARSASG